MKNARRNGAGAALKPGGHREQYNAPPNETQFKPCSDECCYRLARALRAGRLDPDSWSFNFTRSVLKHSKRPAWVPSPKQLAAMRALVAELTEPDTGALIDDGGDNDWAA